MALPRVIWMHIFSFLRARELIRTMTVSKEWKSIAEDTAEPFREVAFWDLEDWDAPTYGEGVPELIDTTREIYRDWKPDWVGLDYSKRKDALAYSLYKKNLKVLRSGFGGIGEGYDYANIQEIHVATKSFRWWVQHEELKDRVKSITFHHPNERDMDEVWQFTDGTTCDIRLVHCPPIVCKLVADDPMVRVIDLNISLKDHKIDWVEMCRGLTVKRLVTIAGPKDLYRFFQRAEDIEAALPNLECIRMKWKYRTIYYLPKQYGGKFHRVKQLELVLYGCMGSNSRDAIELIAYALRHFSSSSLESLCLRLDYDAIWAYYPDDPHLHRLLTHLRIKNLYIDMSAGPASMAEMMRASYFKHVVSSASNIYLRAANEWECIISLNKRKIGQETESNPNKRAKT